jgi:hypothetical protein
MCQFRIRVGHEAQGSDETRVNFILRSAPPLIDRRAWILSNVAGERIDPHR